MIIEGLVKDKNNKPIADAIIEIKGDNFVTIYSTRSNANGYYNIDIPAGRYAFLTAVKEYAVNYLEYWCQNIQLKENMLLNLSFDKLEVYGLHVFSIKGAGKKLMVFFRPMSLPKYQRGDVDIAPNNIKIKVIIDGEEYPVSNVNKVKELAEDKELSAYLIQVETKELNSPWNKLEITIKDEENHYGAAAIFNDNL